MANNSVDITLNLILKCVNYFFTRSPLIFKIIEINSFTNKLNKE